MKLDGGMLKTAAFAWVLVLSAALMTPTALARDPRPGYNNKIPECG